jgi:hypothetical protein
VGKILSISVLIIDYGFKSTMLWENIPMMLRGRSIDLIGLNPSDWTKYVRVADRIFRPKRGQKGSCHESAKEVSA